MAGIQRILQLIVCIGLITALMGCAATQKHESIGQLGDDSIITSKVKAAIYNDPSLNTLQINVSTLNAVVRLSGFVDSAQSIIRAGDLAGRIEGVVDVNNGLIENSYFASDGI